MGWKEFVPFLVLVSVAGLIFSYFDSYQPFNTPLPKASYRPIRLPPHPFPPTHPPTSSIKRILYFTPLFKKKDWGFGIGSAPFEQCSNKNCFVTNKGNPEDFDALLFHERNFKQKVPDQSKRRQEQLYIFVSKEPPIHLDKKWSRFGGFFNWTMTYREDSEILLPYGWLLEEGQDPLSTPIVSSSWLEPHLTSPEVAAKVRALGPRKPVAWLVSNCHTDSQRELYVKELQKHVPVDIFGNCGRPLKCSKKRDKCFEQISDGYKFYLSFENSLCKDYATEKLFRALASYVVPVVMGGVNYSKIVPPRSVINVQDFASPELLGLELNRLLEDESDYLEYFWWKEHYSVQEMRKAKTRAFCTLCEKLHEQTEKENKPSENEEKSISTRGGGRKYLDLVEWLTKDQCWQPEW